MHCCPQPVRLTQPEASRAKRGERVGVALSLEKWGFEEESSKKNPYIPSFLGARISRVWAWVWSGSSCLSLRAYRQVDREWFPFARNRPFLDFGWPLEAPGGPRGSSGGLPGPPGGLLRAPGACWGLLGPLKIQENLNFGRWVNTHSQPVEKLSELKTRMLKIESVRSPKIAIFS